MAPPQSFATRQVGNRPGVRMPESPSGKFWVRSLVSVSLTEFLRTSHYFVRVGTLLSFWFLAFSQ